MAAPALRLLSVEHAFFCTAHGKGAGGFSVPRTKTGPKLIVMGTCVESERFGVANKGSAKPLYVGSIPTRASNLQTTAKSSNPHLNIKLGKSVHPGRMAGMISRGTISARNRPQIPPCR